MANMIYCTFDTTDGASTSLCELLLMQLFSNHACGQFSIFHCYAIHGCMYMCESGLCFTKIGLLHS